jgi:hypothetical protein
LESPGLQENRSLGRRKNRVDNKKKPHVVVVERPPGVPQCRVLARIPGLHFLQHPDLFRAPSQSPIRRGRLISFETILRPQRLLGLSREPNPRQREGRRTYPATATRSSSLSPASRAALTGKARRRDTRRRNITSEVR